VPCQSNTATPTRKVIPRSMDKATREKASIAVEVATGPGISKALEEIGQPGVALTRQMQLVDEMLQASQTALEDSVGTAPPKNVSPPGGRARIQKVTGVLRRMNTLQHTLARLRQAPPEWCTRMAGTTKSYQLAAYYGARWQLACINRTTARQADPITQKGATPNKWPLATRRSSVHAVSHFSRKHGINHKTSLLATMQCTMVHLKAPLTPPAPTLLRTTVCGLFSGGWAEPVSCA
jgi:hypothetical protein